MKDKPDTQLDKLARATYETVSAMQKAIVTKQELRLELNELKDEFQGDLKETTREIISAVEVMLDQKLQRVETALKLQQRIERIEQHLHLPPLQEANH